jgi:hypothetical protein
MVKTGVANLPLHNGKAPRWLFKRMVLISRGIIEVLSYEYGVDEFIKRISDPFWFQALSCVLGYDWHSSGTTTVTCGALKEAINPEINGFAIVGGKGKASRNTLKDIEIVGEKFNFSTKSINHLKYVSRMSAKIDNSAIQDGHSLYHHVLILTEKIKWAVIQQGMNKVTNYARRYHWSSEGLNNFICEPHSAIIGENLHEKVLDMTSKKSEKSQAVSIDLVNDNPIHLQQDWAELIRHPKQQTLDSYLSKEKPRILIEKLNMPKKINWVKMKELYDFQPKNYEELLSIQGVGPNTVRALALISDLIYGEKPSWSDPVKFSFTVGGKDGVPFPVDRNAMDESSQIIKQGIEQAKIGNKDKINAIKRLRKFIPNT